MGGWVGLHLAGPRARAPPLPLPPLRSMAALAEGLALGMRLGLDPRLLTDIFNASSARSWSSETYNPVPGVQEGVPSSRNYAGGFRAQLMAKDLQLAVTAAEHVGAPHPMTHAARALFEKVAAADPAADFSVRAVAVWLDQHATCALPPPPPLSPPSPPGRVQTRVRRGARGRRSVIAACIVCVTPRAHAPARLKR